MKLAAFVLSFSCLVSPAVMAADEGGGLRRQLADDETKYYEYKAKVIVTNMAPDAGGTCQAPVWIGIHDGRFDMFNQGSRASEGIEMIAEEGAAATLAEQFSITRGTMWDGNIGNGPICPGDKATLEFDIKIHAGVPYFFSYASMVLPSNDAFVANAMPRAYKVFNNNAKPLTPVTIIVMGTDVWDAGTELNDEDPMHTPALGETMAGDGVVEYDAIRPHMGFKPKGSGGILDDPRYNNADFTQVDYSMMKIYIEFYEMM